MNLIVEPGPHIRSGNGVRSIMIAVLIALFPTAAAAVYIFGPRAALLTLVCVASCVVSEFLWAKITRRESAAGDCSAAVTGVLLAFNLPVTFPFYMAVIGSVAAIIVVKQMFGGIGQNFANPAVTARIILTLSFTAEMSRFTPAFAYREKIADAVTSATPLAADAPGFSYFELFLGFHGGTIGETCALTLLIGLAYLLITRVIKITTPAAYVGSVALLTLIGGGDPLYAVLSGGLLLGAIFMATDYATTPLTTRGKIIFGVGCGVLTVVIREFASMDEGVSFSILLMNILTPYIDKITMPRAFGAAKKEKKEGGSSA